MDEDKLLGKKELKIIGAFAIIFIVITAVMSIININKIKKEKSIIESQTEIKETRNYRVSPDNLGIESLNETYDMNDLNITFNEYNTNSYEKCFYPMISGLKDKEFENEINNKIKNATADTGNKIDCYVEANFSNVLSIYYYTTARVLKTLNYDLVNKKELKFEDLFTNTASLKNIIYKSGYYAEAEGYVISGPDAKNEIYNSEEEGFKLVNDYLNGKNFNFYFSASKIYFKLDNYKTYKIDIQENYKDIAIFKRFKTKDSIFDGTYEGVKNIKIGITIERDTKYLFKQAKDNLYICYGMKTEDLYEKNANTDDLKKVQKTLFKIWEDEEKNIEIYDDMGKCYSKVVAYYSTEEKGGKKYITGAIKTTETQSRLENYEKYMELYGLKGLTYTQLGFVPAYFDYENKWTYNEEIPPDYKQIFETSSFIYDIEENTIKIEKFHNDENGEASFSEYDGSTGEFKRIVRMKSNDGSISGFTEIKEEPKIDKDNTVGNTTANNSNIISNDISANEIEGPDNNLGNTTNKNKKK